MTELDIEALKAQAKPLARYEKQLARLSGAGIATHTSSSIANLKGADQDTISRTKGFIGKSQREETRFPLAVHHIKIFRNADDVAKLFYKYKGSIQFMQKTNGAS